MQLHLTQWQIKTFFRKPMKKGLPTVYRLSRYRNWFWNISCIKDEDRGRIGSFSLSLQPTQAGRVYAGRFHAKIQRVGVVDSNPFIFHRERRFTQLNRAKCRYSADSFFQFSRTTREFIHKQMFKNGNHFPASSRTKGFLYLGERCIVLKVF